jgi:uncharacterized membrane protein
MLWGWVLSGKWQLGLSVGLLEMLTKIVLYFLHDRAWHRVELKSTKPSHVIHLTKTITWRIIGTLDTVLLSWIISGDIALGLQLGSIEIVTKMILYYLHERLWHRVKYSGETISADA